MKSEDPKKYTFVGYIRVSSRKQEKGLSLEAQEADIRAYARLHGHTLKKIIVETRSTLHAHREGFLEALALVEEGEVHGIMCVKMDRICRNLGEFCSLVDEHFRKDKHKLIVIREQVDTTTSAGRLVANIMMACSQNERDKIGERVKAVFELKRSRSEWTGGGVPLGYRAVYYDTKSGEQVPDKALYSRREISRLKDSKRIVAKLEKDTKMIAAIRLARGLREEGQSFRKIGSFLLEKGFKAKGKRGTWHPETIRRMVASHL